MNQKIFLLFGVLVLCLVGFLGYAKRQSDPDILFAHLINKMQEGKYEEIYENSSDFLRLNADKEDFTERMSDALEKMRKADGELNFRRDREEESSIERIQDESDKAIGRDSSYKNILIIENLGTGDNEVSIMIFFNNKSVFPKFNDLAILPKKNERQDLRVKGIAYQK